MARPVKSDRARAWVSFRVTDDQQAALEQRAEAAGFATVSAFCRAAVFAAKDSRAHLEPAPAEDLRLAPSSHISPQDYRALIALIHRAGVNLNQLAKYANERDALPPDVDRELRAALAEVRHVVRLAQPSCS